MAFDFFKFFMPAVHNSLESAKYHADREESEKAHRQLDATDKLLDEAKADTQKKIEKRDQQK